MIHVQKFKLHWEKREKQRHFTLKPAKFWSKILYKCIILILKKWIFDFLTVCMEDLSTYTDFRKQLIDGVCSLEAVEKLARGIGQVHNRTHLAKVGEQSFSQLKQRFPWVCHYPSQRAGARWRLIEFLIPVIYRKYLQVLVGTSSAIPCFVIM